MSKNKNKNVIPQVALSVTPPVAEANPLAAENPLAAPPAYVSEEGLSSSVPPVATEEEEVIPEVVVGSNPSEFDPDLENDFANQGNDSFSQAEPEEFTEEEKKEIKAAIPPSKIDHLGNPAVPDFDPRDPTKGFYQGIDAQTGKRIYSER